MKSLVLQLYRFAVVAVIAWLIRDVAVRQRIQGESPLMASEVVAFLPTAHALRPDDSARDGLFVLDRAGRELGYVVRTQPRCRDIIGYAGVTNALIVLDPNWKILGLQIYASEDTTSYVHDISIDRRFLKKWNALTWDAAADLGLKAAGIEGVSGATMTSMAIAQSVKARLRLSRDELAARVPLRFAWRDYAMLLVLAVAALIAFGKPERRHRWKRPYQIALIVYVGFIAGDLIAQKLFVGWTRAGIPWTTAPGLVLLAAAALIVPWTTGKPFYCHHICPHGAAQELTWNFRLMVGRALRARLTGSPPTEPDEEHPSRQKYPAPAPALSASVIRGLENLPAGLIVLTLVVALLAIPLDLAGIEPFAAYIVRSAGIATLVVAAVGLIASFFVPQAYCRFGCPTGALLNFVRHRGTTDRFSRRDFAALALVALAVLLNWKHLSVIFWLQGL
ncbi:MAG: FMN-binding protein [Undibacterium sp.]|nr:FMN-binding protein [Opitutaceae bacterium]